jgi:uncharacterized delta-60 repeat protein
MSGVAVIYTSLTTLRQVDLKKIIAYSSVAHMAFVTIGIFTFNLYGIEGSLIIMLSHGFISSALFLCIGVLYDRHHSRLIKYYSGLTQVMPLYSFFFVFFSMANLGFPGTSSFAGEFLTFTGTTITRLVRLSPDGFVDASFVVGSGFDNSIFDVKVQSDGKILVSGSFSTYQGTAVNRLVRLNSNGTLDSAFSTNQGTGLNGVAQAMAVQPDGKIVLGGTFTTFNGVTANTIVRLNADGTRDTAPFTTNIGTGANGLINDIKIRPDGRIIVVGSFSTFNGATVNNIVQLNSNGTRDTAFTAANGTGASGIVQTIAVQPDGKVLVGGGATFNGTTVNNIYRLNFSGSLDTAFTANIGTGISSRPLTILVQSDGKILVGGQFTTFNGATVGYIVRLNADGTRDTAFTTNTGTGAGYQVFTSVLQSDGKIILGGLFTTFNGNYVGRIVRLSGELAG